MWPLFFQSIRLYLVWWLRSLYPGAHPGAPLSFRRLTLLLLAFPPFLLLQGIHWICLALDRWFFPRYRDVPVEAPVFIIGVPRSGTTFLHRTLALDQEQFSTVPTWEAILAPSILEKKILLFLSAGDRALGRPFRRCLDWISRGSRHSMESIHPTGPDEPEEDYLWLLPAGGAFILLLAFPFSRHLRKLAAFDQLPKGERDRWIAFHRSCIQRHLYARGRDRRFLSKNAAFSTWVEDLAGAYPDASFVLTVRDPANVYPSQLRSLEPARKLFGTDPDGTWTAGTFAEVLSEGYQGISRGLTRLEEGQARRTAVIDQKDLAAGGRSILPEVIERIAADRSAVLEAAINALEPHHAHPSIRPDSGITFAGFEDCAKPHFDTILASVARLRPNPSPSA